MQKITPFLWFNDNAEEAMNFYVATFKNAKILHLMKQGDGKVFGGSLEIEGQEFKTLNGGPQYSFTPAISLFVNCPTQEEVDELWAKLIADGGEEGRCGWLKDKFGLYKMELVVLSPSKLLYKRSLLMNKGFYDKSEYENFRSFREKIAKTDNSKIVLTKQ